MGKSPRDVVAPSWGFDYRTVLYSIAAKLSFQKLQVLADDLGCDSSVRKRGRDDGDPPAVGTRVPFVTQPPMSRSARSQTLR